MHNITIVIPFRNGYKTIDRLLDSLPSSLPVVIVDDLSDTPYQSDRGNVSVVRMDNRGYFAGAVNVGLKQVDTDILVLNQDVWFEGNGWQYELDQIRKVVEVAGDPVLGHPAWPYGYVQGTFMYMSRDAIKATGLMNEKDFPLWGATAEWQLRACRKGFGALMWKSLKKWMRHERRKKSSFGSAITETLKEEPKERRRFIRTPPLVSVIVPCFNYGHYLEDCINSLIGGETSIGYQAPQTLQAFEVIIVDDASKDNSVALAKQFVNPAKGVRLIQNPTNLGTASTINVGIASAYGQYITILSADDMREPWSLETQYRIVEKDNRAVPYEDLGMFKWGKRGAPWPMQEYDFERNLHRNQMPAGIMFSKEAWKEVGGYPDTFKYGREDWAFGVALGINGYCGVRVPKAGYLIRREKHNRSLKNNTKNWRGRFVRQMKATFPLIYNGSRPPMCCGNQVASAVAGQSKMIAQKSGGQDSGIIVGQEGMVQIKYIGSNAGSETWEPPPKYPPRVQYVFGGNRNKGFIDKRHLEWFVQITDSLTSKKIFVEDIIKEVEVKEKAIEIIPPAPKVEMVAEPVSIPHEAIEEAVTQKLMEYSTYSVAKLNKLDLSQDSILELIRLEEAKKKPRITAVRYLESILSD